MLVVSIGFHAGLLLLPLPKAPQAKTQELKTVKITDLIASQKHPSRTSETKPFQPTPRAPAQQAIAPTPAQTKPKIIPTPDHGASASPTPTSSPVSPPTPATPTATPTPETPTSNASAGSVAEFLGQLDSGNGSPETKANSPSPDLFTDPNLFFDQVTPLNQARLKPEILRAAWIAGKTSVQVYVEILVTQGQHNNFQVLERGTYGQGTVYEVKQESNTWYFNLVPTKNSDGTVIVVWQRDPSAPL